MPPNSERPSLDKLIERNIGRGITVARVKGSNTPFTAWHRDIAHCWHLLIGEAVTLTQAVYKNDHEALEALDTIVKEIALIYTTSVTDNLNGIMHFGELYKYLNEDSKLAYTRHRVMSTFGQFFLQAFFCYIFTSTEMAMGVIKAFTPLAFEFNTAVNILATLNDDTRREVLKQMQAAGVWPIQINCQELNKRVEDYISVIKLDQQRRYKEMEEKARVGGKESQNTAGNKTDSGIKS